MKTLYLAFQWNSIRYSDGYIENDLLEIAALSVERGTQEKTRYESMVYSPNMNFTDDSVIRLLKEGKYVLEQAAPEYMVCNKCESKFSDCETIVVWDKHEYQMFMDMMREYGARLQARRVITLQGLLRRYAGWMYGKKDNLEEVLDYYNIPYEAEKIVLAKYRRTLLIKLCGKIVNQQDTTGDTAKNSEEMNPETAWNEEKFETDIAKLCNRYQIAYRFAQNYIDLHTHVAAWRIQHVEGEVKSVYHENYSSGPMQHGGDKFNSGFHRQKIKTKKIDRVIKYIYYHDRDFWKREEGKTRICAG